MPEHSLQSRHPLKRTVGLDAAVEDALNASIQATQ
jgi:hypothetical protein